MINSCKIIVLSLLSFLCYQNLPAQMTNKEEYVVITFERTKNKVHRMNRYYWIIPSDSISTQKLPLYSLYTETYFDKSELEECCQGGVIDVLEISNNDTVSFSDEYNIALRQLNEIIFQNRKKVQTITYQWYNPKHKEIIQIYATPITGNFCYCMQRFTPQIKNYFQEGIVFLPLMEFKYDAAFWNTDQARLIESFDFSDIRYVNTQ